MQFFTHVFVVAIQTELHNTTQSAQIYFLTRSVSRKRKRPMAPDRLRIHTQTTNREKNEMKQKKMKKNPIGWPRNRQKCVPTCIQPNVEFHYAPKKKKKSRSAKIRTKPTKKQWEQICWMAHALFKFIQFSRPKLRLSEFFFLHHRCSSNVIDAVCFAFHRVQLAG